MAENAEDQAQAEQAAQAAQVQAAQPRQAAPADVPDDAEPDETGAQAPRVWLIWNKDQDRRYNHVPTQGSGVNGELTSDEVQAYFTRAQYKDATARDPDGKIKPMYLRARKAELRPTAPHEVSNGES